MTEPGESDSGLSSPPSLGLSGRIAQVFLTSEITPLLAIIGLLLGLFAVLITPREEEPQINVTFANVFIPFPGAAVKEVESLVTTPAEQLVREIDGVEHVYSVSVPGMAQLTVRFEVGQPRTDAIVRLYNAFYSNQDWLPPNMGIGAPLIKPKGIDDVPVVAGTLWSEDPDITATDLLRIAHMLETELQRVPGTRDIETLGGADRVVHVRFDPERLAGYHLSLDELRSALGSANASRDADALVSDGQSVLVQAGTFLGTPEEVADLVVGVSAGAPILLRDVADVTLNRDQPSQYVNHGLGPGGMAGDVSAERFPAVTISVSKKPGQNAVEVSKAVIARFEQMRGIYFPDGVEATITRNYGITAEEKAQTLIHKLAFATASVVLLVLIALGFREALVVGAAVVVTLAITLFASWAWGFTLNRVSLFALIFSIGILVDDAIVVVENIHRHRHLGGRSLVEAIPAAVDEVGGPTILATLAVIAALLPMAFVTGLMGPYMRPIPINAATGMLVSLAVAFVFTPWLYRRAFLHKAPIEAHDGKSRLDLLLVRMMMPFLGGDAGKVFRWMLLVVLMLLVIGSIALTGVGAVVMKMLPFDNKSEFQVLVDMPEGTPLETTHGVQQALADYLRTVPEVVDYQIYTGTSAPINFNGLVRQYYLRRAPHQGDIQVNLAHKDQRKRKSHEIVLAVRPALVDIAKGYNATIKMIEVPPGPPVLAPLVAEIYGLDYSGQMLVANQVKTVFASTADVVDVDDTIETAQEKIVVVVDRARATKLGVTQRSVVDAVATAVRGEDVSFLHDPQAKYPVPIRLELPADEQSDPERLQALRVRSASGELISLSSVAEIRRTKREDTIHHKDLLPVVYVTGDVAGETDSPLYGMAAIASTLDHTPINGAPIRQYLIEQPENPY